MLKSEAGKEAPAGRKLGTARAFEDLLIFQPRRRNLWVTERFEWRPGSRLAQPANPMPDSAASASVFVARCVSNQFALHGKGYGVREDRCHNPSARTPRSLI